MVVNIGILAVLFLFFRDKVTVLTHWIKPTSLTLMMVGNILLLGYRIWAADDAYRSAKGREPRVGVSKSAASLIVATSALAFVLLAPSVVFGYYVVIQYDLITSVFSSSSATTTTVASTSATTPPSSGAAGETAGTDAETTTTVVAQGNEIWDGLDRLNILLIGGDFGAGRTGIRTDTMITVSIDPDHRRGCDVLGSPQLDTSAAPRGPGCQWDCGYNCYPELINELWVAGETLPGVRSPDREHLRRTQ